MNWDDERIAKQIRREEGTRNRPYRCSAGYLTIGIGRNLDKVPLSEDEILYLFENDYERARAAAVTLPCWTSLGNAPRRGVIISMVFQMGRAGVARFQRMQAAIMSGDFERASAEMLDSLWAKQTPERAMRLAEQMRTGKWVD